ncbi:thioredoxin domain-containing protein [Vulcanisaeta souniana]|uniref:Thioredoxin domain-containing protein n=1 Tax=Vulcanisaeta souniana JCM 11219 TaxID=1293586 RepID=A0A830EI06_9CREN|nr:thioredoxin domain-containing protein [Vulcanisaeta souniana]BDR91485.1 thioredoxin domain-containing protein [Vulcanisaeta souniana JCM 11219]GGI73508.1 thioredoxin domain-containing protein [Vulcanisaeta souniana JCM 11219]
MDFDERIRCLTQSQSPYVLETLNSPVKWWGWCAKAFERAVNEDKPLLIDIGAGWCHWCHVMDETTYKDLEVVQLINDYFIPIKVDRDERPDIDRRYQEAALLIAGQGGWPLTAFATPKGEVIYAGTYFPPRDDMGLPGMVRVLRAVLDAYRSKRDQIGELVREINNAITSSYVSITIEDLDTGVVDEVVTKIMDMYDHEHGGFGMAPKFPQVTYHALLLYRGFYTGNAIINIVRETLIGMGRGGIYDQLGGGFHRYSVDSDWLMPHFEKLLIDNAELLMNYSEAYAVTMDNELREIGAGIINYVNGTLANPDGGYYASQDADADFRDEGGYYKWSVDELRGLLSNDEFNVIYWYFGVFRFQGNEKVVLHRALGIEEVANKLGISIDMTRSLLNSAISKMINARSQRKNPRIDTTIYAGWSSAMSIAYTMASDYMGINDVIEHSLKTVDFIMNNMYRNDGLRRAFRCNTLSLPGLLEDYSYTLLAALVAYSHTGNRKYLEFAIKLGNDIVDKFRAPDSGFYDTDMPDEPMTLRIKPIADTPNWSPNSLALIALMNLYRVTGIDKFSKEVNNGIRALYSLAMRYGTATSSYFIALDWYLRDPPKVVIVGDANDDFMRLLKTALRTFRPGKLVIPIISDSVDDLLMDNSIRAMVNEYRRKGSPLAYVCAYSACTTPIVNEETLRNVLTDFMRDRYA